MKPRAENIPVSRQNSTFGTIFSCNKTLGVKNRRGIPNTIEEVGPTFLGGFCTRFGTLVSTWYDETIPPQTSEHFESRCVDTLSGVLKLPCEFPHLISTSRYRAWARERPRNYFSELVKIRFLNGAFANQKIDLGPERRYEQ